MTSHLVPLLVHCGVVDDVADEREAEGKEQLAVVVQEAVHGGLEISEGSEVLEQGLYRKVQESLFKLVLFKVFSGLWSACGVVDVTATVPACFASLIFLYLHCCKAVDGMKYCRGENVLFDMAP